MRGQHQQQPRVHSDVWWKSNSALFTYSFRIIWLRTIWFSRPCWVSFTLSPPFTVILRALGAIWTLTHVCTLCPFIPSQDSLVHTRTETQFNTVWWMWFQGAPAQLLRWLIVHGFALLHTQLIQCQCNQAKSWLWGSLWQDSISVFGPNGGHCVPALTSHTGSLTSGSASRLIPCGFALIDGSNHNLSAFQCSPVSETNPVSPNRYYHFTLKNHTVFN